MQEPTYARKAPLGQYEVRGEGQSWNGFYCTNLSCKSYFYLPILWITCKAFILLPFFKTYSVQTASWKKLLVRLFNGVFSMLLLFLSPNVFKVKPFSRPHLPLHKYMYFFILHTSFGKKFVREKEKKVASKILFKYWQNIYEKDLNWKWKVDIVLSLKSHNMPSVLVKFPLSLLDISSHHRAARFSWHWRAVMTREMNPRENYPMILNDVIISSHLLQCRIFLTANLVFSDLSLQWCLLCVKCHHLYWGIAQKWKRETVTHLPEGLIICVPQTGTVGCC